MPYYAKSLFTAGPRHPLGRNARRIWLARAEIHRRSGAITALHVQIGRCLLNRLGVTGQCDPSHDTIATDAGCSERTVRRALARLNALGLLTWQRRVVRAGWRTAQTSNAYQFGHGLPPVPRVERKKKAKPSGSTDSLSAAANQPRSVAQQIAAALAWAGEVMAPQRRDAVVPFYRGAAMSSGSIPARAITSNARPRAGLAIS